MSTENTNPEKAAQEAAAAAQAAASKGEEGLPGLSDEAQKEIRRLRDEAAKYRTRAKEYEQFKTKADEYEKMITKQAEEQGKFKELYEKQLSEVERLKKLDEENQGYKSYFEEQLAEELKTATDTTKELIAEMKEWPAQKRLEWLKKLKGQPVKPSPAGARPGNDGVNMPQIKIEDYRGPEGRAKLLKLQQTDPKLADAILKAKAGIH